MPEKIGEGRNNNRPEVDERARNTAAVIEEAVATLAEGGDFADEPSTFLATLEALAEKTPDERSGDRS